MHYVSAMSTLVSSMGALPEPSDFSLCLNYEHIGAQGQEVCSRGYTYVPVQSGVGGICVGSCRKGDRRVTRTLRNMPFMDMLHDIDLPVCQVAEPLGGERGVKSRGTRALGVGGILSIVLWVIIISWAIKQFRGALQPAQAQYPYPSAYGYGY